MGNCCSGETADGQLSLENKTRGRAFKGFEHILDDREIAGLKGERKMFLIVKI